MKTLLLVATLLLSINNFAKVWEVKMLNKSTKKVNGKKLNMVFEPNFLVIKKGDSVKFIPSKRGHSVQSLRGKNSAPTGTKTWKSKLNKEHIQKFDKVGIHGFECKPHYAMGMVGAVVVEKPTNLVTFETNKKVRGKAKKRLKLVIEKIKNL